jgi:hypothetical protein
MNATLFNTFGPKNSICGNDRPVVGVNNLLKITSPRRTKKDLRTNTRPSVVPRVIGNQSIATKQTRRRFLALIPREKTLVFPSADVTRFRGEPAEDA